MRNIGKSLSALHDQRGKFGQVAIALGSCGLVACSSPEQVAERQVQPTTTQGTLPATNPTLAFFEDPIDARNSVWVSLSDQQASSDANVVGCTATPTVWNVPVRVGPTPWQLKGCYEKDAMPAGLPSTSWGAAPITAPTVAKLGSQWVVLYTATKRGSTPSQRCIGEARGAHPAGPFTTPAQVFCPSSTSTSASDPELFFDRQVGQWFLLWTENVGACHSRIMIRQFDPATVRFATGSVERELLRSTDNNVRFSEISATDCSSGPRRRIESPTMVRSDPSDPLNPNTTSKLWLFFSGNDRLTKNYATGWAECGTGSPASGGACTVGVPNSGFRPLWGDPTRVPSVAGNNATPHFGWPALPAFGGMSLAVKSPTNLTPQPVFAAAQLRFGTAPGELVFRFDKSGPPALLEADPVSWYAAPNTFGQPVPPFNSGVTYPAASAGPNTPSGQPVSSRPVSGLAWSHSGLYGLFNEVTTDGTLFTGGKSAESNNVFPGANVTRLGAFDPKTSMWHNVPILTSTGASEIAGAHSAFWGRQLPGGGFVADIQALENNAVAFTISAGFPAAYWGAFGNPGPAPTNAGAWPNFGIATKVNGEWRVLAENQWTGTQLGTLAGSDAVLARQVCPESPGVLPPGESACGAFNELAALPKSKHLILTQYLTNDGGLAALRYAPIAGSNPLYSIQWTGRFAYPRANRRNNAVPPRAFNANIKEIQVDRSSAVNDERFVISFDLSFNSEPKDPPPPNVIQEFAYRANEPDLTKRIVPTSPPILGYASARYDKDGNLWAKGTAEIGVWAKHASGRKISTSCGFDPANTEFQYFTGIDWGVRCPPDYVIRQPETLYWDHFDLFPPQGTTPQLLRFFAPMEMTEHPTEKIMVAVNLGGFNYDAGQVMPIRYGGSGDSMTFDIGNVTDTGTGFFGPREWKEFRPGSFDRNGRLWFNVNHRGPEAIPPHWVKAVDVAQLLDPAPVILPSGANSSVIVQAENVATTRTCASTPPPNACSRTALGSLVVDPNVLVQTSSRQDPNGTVGTGAGTVLVTDSGHLASGNVGHKAGRADYKVYVPSAGCYKVTYVTKSSGATGGNIVMTVDPGPTQLGPFTSTVNSTTWGLVANNTPINMSQGLHTIALTPPADTAAAQWHLDYFILTRSACTP